MSRPTGILTKEYPPDLLSWAKTRFEGAGHVLPVFSGPPVSTILSTSSRSELVNPSSTIN
jgi:hypothetical protein